MPLTLEDIARVSGVSRSTVSRVINGDVNVKEETRQKVMDVIQYFNFQPNLAARGLAAGKTSVVGLVIPAGVTTIFTDPYFPQLVLGVSAACNAHDYSVMFWLAEPEYERRVASAILHNGLVDGVVVSSALINDPLVKSLAEGNMPFILIGRHPTLDVNYLDVDNIQGGRDATMHLLRMGRKRVATISGPGNMIAGQDRLEGYRLALQDRNLPWMPELVVEGDFTDAGGYTAMIRLLSAKPDAVFVASDVMALGALRALREMNVRVPEDVALVGFDDIPAASKAECPLTTIRQPTQRLGAAAVEVLIDLIQHPGSQPRRVVLSTELVIRKSCGALAA
jgi:LacI family transcriptional regulator